MSILEQYIKCLPAMNVKSNITLHFNLSIVIADPPCLNLLLYEETKQRKIWIFMVSITSLCPLHSTVLFTYSVCSLQVFLIQEMVPTAAIYSTPLNKDTFSGILANSLSLYSFLSLNFLVLLSSFPGPARPYLESYFFTLPPPPVKDY